MNRRGFFAALIGAPVIAKAVATASAPVLSHAQSPLPDLVVSLKLDTSGFEAAMARAQAAMDAFISKAISFEQARASIASEMPVLRGMGLRAHLSDGSRSLELA